MEWNLRAYILRKIIKTFLFYSPYKAVYSYINLYIKILCDNIKLSLVFLGNESLMISYDLVIVLEVVQ